MKYWEGKNVFVTGATGFVGGWLVKHLVENKARVVVLTRDEVPNSNFMLENLNNKVIIVKGDLTNQLLIQRLVNEYEIDTIFHLAAQALVTIANSNPVNTFESNIKGTWNILEAARLNNLVKRVVIASSDKAYGSPKILPYTEDMPLQGEHPYDVSKSCADLLARAYYKTYGLPVAITRCSNIYGGGDINFNRIIPGLIKAVLKNEEFVIRSDGTFERDYMYVEDAVNAYLTLAENLDRDEIKGESFNFGTETPINVLELIEKIKKILNIHIEKKVLGQAKGEIDKQYLGCEKARRMLNWKPHYNLNEGILKTFEWYKKYENKVIN
ncbi:GDP-mannose 4,6-dehydratase [Candidatus Woesearchaeota archaeon]|nr:GDP-mannose 4,6-dehydratase [Candidatus Woesearchaeota archaeon]